MFWRIFSCGFDVSIPKKKVKPSKKKRSMKFMIKDNKFRPEKKAVLFCLKIYYFKAKLKSNNNIKRLKAFSTYRAARNSVLKHLFVSCFLFICERYILLFFSFC